MKGGETATFFSAGLRRPGSPDFQRWTASLPVAMVGCMRRLISTGSPFERDIGYSRAVVQDGWVFLAGTTGYDYSTMTMPEGVEDQCKNALATIEKVLTEAGAALSDVVRVTYILPDPEDWQACWPITSAAFGEIRPASTMFSAALQNPSMKIEIEVTAKLRA